MLAFHSTRRALLTALSASVGSAVLAMPATAEIPKLLSAAAPAETVQFQLYFKPRNVPTMQRLIEAQTTEGSPEYHHWLTPEEFAERFGPTSTMLARVTEELTARGLTVVEHSGQMLNVSGPASAVEAAFNIRLSHAQFADGFRSVVADRALTMPPAIAAAEMTTPNFSTASPKHKDSHIIGEVPLNQLSATGPYLTRDLRQAYDFPSATSLTAAGVNIGILMNGGFNPPDMVSYFVTLDGLNASTAPHSIVNINVNGGAPYDPNNSGETHLDIQQSGGMSLGANIGLYNISDLSSATVIFGLNRIIQDDVADVVNMSFSGPEVDYLAKNNGGIDNTAILYEEYYAFYQGLLQGITFVGSTGDHGSNPPAAPAGAPTLSAADPASDPLVLAVGGTNLVTQHVAGSKASGYVSENAGLDHEKGTEVWASGGGISIIWAKPSYQSLVPTPSSKFRTVPDLAQHMGGCPGDAVGPCHTPNSSDIEVIGGKAVGVIGTSASSPDIVGLLALRVAANGGGKKNRLGFIHTTIYTYAKNQIAGKGTPFHHKGIPGSNGAYSTKVPYDLVIGNGSVDGRQLMGLTSLPPAGVPGTASNP